MLYQFAKAASEVFRRKWFSHLILGGRRRCGSLCPISNSLMTLLFLARPISMMSRILKSVVVEIWDEQPTVKIVFKLGNDLKDLRKRTDVIGRGEAAINPSDVEMRPSRARRSLRNLRVVKYGSRIRGFRSKKKRMLNGECTVNVGNVGEMDSQGHFILKVKWRGEPHQGEMNHISKE
ncbi:hypothetical protein Acr_21g0004740 [Actinidia rufa]|uniref:Uncharacterized protein n=1 Tax=Actinidia rufa TaxID=165716 RepID=A0A7J0GGH4_9ERIC|nr:hypothetical protein Acr_21g0004740 [Actinidia rufa]